ncbi:hypothetical protein HID58_066484 [Brassica napus]|uniref:Uncharacterized protein n=1 Tax=Brassica napus TaxID=3708 RepID=A0ABQ7ZFT6_BRANA|nr:hypothetical protein HID58_066484 [Brassica napus]
MTVALTGVGGYSSPLNLASGGNSVRGGVEAGPAEDGSGAPASRIWKSECSVTCNSDPREGVWRRMKQLGAWGGCVFVGSTPVMCVLSFLDTGSIVYGSKGGGKGSASPRPNGASSSARSRSVEEAIPTVLVGGAWQSWAFSSGLRESSNGLVEHMLRSMVFAVPWYWQIW